MFVARIRPLVVLAVTALGTALLPAPSHAQDLGNWQIFQTGLTRAGFLGCPPGEPDRILIAQLNGVVRVIENGVLLPTPFLDISARANASHGLVGIAFPPDYATTRRFYVNYVNRTTEFGTQPLIARYTTSANPNIANTTEEILLRTGTGSGDHVAGWMGFGHDNYLYIARGDAGGPPQNPDFYQGKMLRIDVSPATGYAIPPDNPFVGIAGLDEIAAMGLRNPYRDGFDSLTGDLYIADVGQSSREEISFVPAGTIAGRNFGWPCMEGEICSNSTPPCSCDDPPMTMPIHTYGRSDGYTIIGGVVYRGSAMPRWRGRYFFADLSSRVRSLRVVNAQAVDVQEHTADLNEVISPRLTSPVAFGEDASRELYILELSGRILKLVPEFHAADWNTDGTVNSEDFFAFLTDFFAFNADITGDHATTSADFFEYITIFFNE